MTGLLECLTEAGITLEVEGEGLRVRAATPPPAVLLDEIRQNKEALIEYLRNREALAPRLLEPEEDLTSNERKIAELIARYQAGQFIPKVRARLAEIFADNPSNAEARLLRACTHVGITGEGLEEADRLAQQAYEAAGWPWLEEPE